MHSYTCTTFYRWLAVLILLGLAWQRPLAAATTPEPLPREQIIATSNNLLVSLQKHKDEIKQDMDLAYRLAEDTVIPQLDFPRITRSVLGKHWRTATAAQREQLTREFRTLLIRAYVTAMVTYVDQILQHADNVQFPPERSQQTGDTANVTMLIQLESGQQVAVQYAMYRHESGWRIYDVQVEGISLALTYRSTFSQEIAQKGIDELIVSLAARNREAARESLPGM